MVSIIICTHNRSDMLQDALISYTRMHGLKKVPHELIVVDNNSTDDTKRVLQGFSGKIPVLRYVFEKNMGVSHARNTGIRECMGEIIAFVDDDVLFSYEWLVSLQNGIETWGDAEVYGGKSVAKWEVTKPSWFVDEGYFSMRGMIAHFEPDIPEGYTGEFPYGCNMAFRRESLESVGVFDSELGRKGNRLLAGEEYDLLQKITSSGGRIVYLPKAMVHHRVTGKRGEKNYYMEWKKSAAESRAYKRLREYGIPKKVFGLPLGAAKKIPRLLISIFRDICSNSKISFFAYKLKLLHEIYYFNYIIKLSKG